MVKLTPDQIKKKMDFIKHYVDAENAAEGAIHDPNANVDSKNIATLEAELHKDFNRQINRALLTDKIKEMFDEETAQRYLEVVESGELYKNDETSVKPYTYGANESILVEYNGKKLLTSFELLYEIVNDVAEVCLDAKKGVWAKYPENLYTYDTQGKTRITRIIKKTRHRDLLRIKTQYGEDIIVTDNHPMIVDINDINDTVEAKHSLEHYQYKQTLPFESNKKYVMLEEFTECDIYGGVFGVRNNDEGTRNLRIDFAKRKIELNEKFGYCVGFFIAEGHYERGSIRYTQKDRKILEKIASYLYEATGVGSKITKRHNKHTGITMYKLSVHSRIIEDLFRNYFMIPEYAYRKTLPLNIFETNKEFIDGIFAGFIDGDGTIYNKNAKPSILIAAASRTFATQAMIVLRSFNVNTTIAYDETLQQAFGKNSNNYPIFRLSFALDGDLQFKLSEKVNEYRDKMKQKKNKYKQNKAKITLIRKVTNEKLLDNYIYDITTETSHFVCNNLIVHNCTSVSMYPLLTDGMTKIGGESKAPKHFHSFNGVFINFVFATAAQFAGAVATVEWLMYFDYFARVDYGDNYLETHENEIKEALQHVVYSLNQPAAARGYQSVFWNISIYDKYYFDAMFGNFVFPDMSKPKWETVDKLQKYFMKWFNKERTKSILTYPVVTAALLTENGELKDKDYEEFLAEEMSKGNSFFIFMSDSPHALSSCCRLKNDIEDQINEFSYTLGAGGVQTGSIGVMTMNLNRLTQDAVKLTGADKYNYQPVIDYIREKLKEVHKFQAAYRAIIKWYEDKGMLPVYDAGFISLDKQFNTIGVNALVEAAEFLGFEIYPNKEYMKFVTDMLKMFSEENKKARKLYNIKYNTEFVPGESLSKKLKDKDEADGYWVPERPVYSSYIYAPEDDSVSALDKLQLHGKDTSEFLDGGQAAHINLEDYPTKESFKKLMKVAATVGCTYWTTNVKITICNDCGHIDKRTSNKCPVCGSKNVDWATRVIGYLKRVSAFSKARQEEEKLRHYHKIEK